MTIRVSSYVITIYHVLCQVLVRHFVSRSLLPPMFSRKKPPITRLMHIFDQGLHRGHVDTTLGSHAAGKAVSTPKDCTLKSHHCLFS